MKTIENKIFLEFTRCKSNGKVIFENEGCHTKKIIENDNFIKGNILCDSNGNDIGDYNEGKVDYCYDEGGSYEWYGGWCVSADDLSEEEAKAILRKFDDSDDNYLYVGWAEKVLCLDNED